nr:unnamed protein product [Callosobruchus analis]
MPLKIKYDPVHGFDYVNNFMDPFIPDYRVHRSYDFYDWPWRLRIWYPNRRFRNYLNRELGVSVHIYILNRGRRSSETN